MGFLQESFADIGQLLRNNGDDEKREIRGHIWGYLILRNPQAAVILNQAENEAQALETPANQRITSVVSGGALSGLGISVAAQQVGLSLEMSLAAGFLGMVGGTVIGLTTIAKGNNQLRQQAREIRIQAMESVSNLTSQQVN